MNLVEHEDGVWLGLANEAYQKDWAMGSGGLKTGAHSWPLWWWRSPFNQIEPPAPEKVDPKWARQGTALHVCLLEGMDVYDRCYGVMPTAEDYPDALASLEQLKDACREYMLPVSGTKDDLAQRLIERDPEIQILDRIQKTWLAENEDCRPIPGPEDRRIRLLHRMAMAAPDEFSLPGGEVVTLKAALTGGLSEVSVFWTDENGIRHRARFDKLKHRVTVDLKSFSSWNETHDFDIGLLREAKHRQYPLQTVHYDEGRHQMRRLVKEGKIFGGSPDQVELLKSISESDEWGWMWVYAVTEGAPLMKGVRFDLGGLTAAEWRKKREDALARHVAYREFFGGYEHMWFDWVGIIEPDDDMWMTA